MRTADTKRTVTASAAVSLQDVIELEAALQSGGFVNSNQKKKEVEDGHFDGICR